MNCNRLLASLMAFQFLLPVSFAWAEASEFQTGLEHATAVLRVENRKGKWSTPTSLSDFTDSIEALFVDDASPSMKEVLEEIVESGSRGESTDNEAAIVRLALLTAWRKSRPDSYLDLLCSLLHEERAPWAVKDSISRMAGYWQFERRMDSADRERIALCLDDFFRKTKDFQSRICAVDALLGRPSESLVFKPIDPTRGMRLLVEWAYNDPPHSLEKRQELGIRMEHAAIMYQLQSVERAKAETDPEGAGQWYDLMGDRIEDRRRSLLLPSAPTEDAAE